MVVAVEPVGVLVRRWRERRSRSQLDVSLAADVSTRHLSYVETGRANPSRELIERLCDELDVPLRERNAFYLGAGFAPEYPERPFVDLGAARTAIDLMLRGLEPNPALAVNVRWDLLAANRAMAAFFQGVSPDLLEPPVNVLRVSLHPRGLADHIVNLVEWRAHVLGRVRRQLERTAAPGLAQLLADLESYAGADDGGDDRRGGSTLDGIAIPLRLETDQGELALLYTTTVFGAPRDVTLDEVAIEAFFPADDATRELLVSGGLPSRS
jgi:transcriptional regulator with XRE-family HTH domain